MKILIHSNAPWVPTGYGKQANLAARVLVGLGHQVSFSTFAGLTGQPITWQIPGTETACAVYPSGIVPFGPDIIIGNAKMARADLIVSIMDTYKLAPAADEIKTCGIPFVPLLVSDSKAMNGGPSMLDQPVITASGALPAAVCRFTQDCLKEIESAYPAGWEVPFVPHTVDTSVYKPVKNRDKLRRQHKTQEQFIIGIMGANKDPMRKGYAEQFEAFAEFSSRHPEARLSLFTIYDSPGGLRLDEMAHDFGVINKSIFMPSFEQIAGLISEEACAEWFNTLDILSAASYGEGFCVPALEAQACGTPVTASNWSALPELVERAGWLIEGERYWNAAHRGWWLRPRVSSIVEAWEAAYEARHRTSSEWRDRSHDALATARDYDLAAAAGYWKTLIDQVESWPRP